MNKFIVGIDVGYGISKVVHDGGRFFFPSIVGSYDGPAYDERAVLAPIVIDGESFLVGEQALRHSKHFFTSRDRHWTTTKAYAALVQYALRTAVLSAPADLKSRGALRLNSGLPVQYYKADKPAYQILMTKLSTSIGGIRSVGILPQPLGTFLSVALDDNGKFHNSGMMKERVGICDIGSGTTDCITVEALEIVEREVAGFEIGICALGDSVARSLNDKYSLKLDTNGGMKAILEGKVVVFGKDQPISDIVQPHVADMTAAVASRLRTLWGTGAGLNRVLITGGGANLLGPGLIKAFQHATVVPGAMYANADGYYKAARRG